MRLLLLIGLLGVTSIEDSTSRASNPLKTVWLALYPESKEREQECTGCAQSKIASNDPILTELRVEYVKQQILKKLRLSKPPEVSLSLSTIPKPLTSGHVLELRPGVPSRPEKQVESFYGKTDQIVVFPKEDMGDTRNCQLHTNYLSGINAADCFTFLLPNEIQFVDVTSAELWFYKEADAKDVDNKQTFVISELDHWDLGRSFQKNSIMAIFESSVGEGWIKTDVGYTVKRWVEEQRPSHSLQIACNTCSIDRESSLVSVEPTLKPFLVIHTSPLPQKNRPKRNSNCVPEMKECCRDELYISFDDIGWSAWILHPRGYHAYFCHGSCSSTASLTTTGSAHSNVIRRYLTGSKNGLPRGNEIMPCCSPSQLSPIQLLYVDSNNTLTQKTLPNMVVEACGCM